MPISTADRIALVGAGAIGAPIAGAPWTSHVDPSVGSAPGTIELTGTRRPRAG